jgi:hypothetical protein
MGTMTVPGGRGSLIYTSALQISGGRLLAFDVWTICVPDCPSGGRGGTDTFSFDEATGSWSAVSGLCPIRRVKCGCCST